MANEYDVIEGILIHRTPFKPNLASAMDREHKANIDDYPEFYYG